MCIDAATEESSPPRTEILTGQKGGQSRKRQEESTRSKKSRLGNPYHLGMLEQALQETGFDAQQISRSMSLFQPPNFPTTCNPVRMLSIKYLTRSVLSCYLPECSFTLSVEAPIKISACEFLAPSRPHFSGLHLVFLATSLPLCFLTSF